MTWNDDPASRRSSSSACSARWRRRLRARRRGDCSGGVARRHALLLFFSLLLAFLGGSGIIHAAPPGDAIRARPEGGPGDRRRGRQQRLRSADRTRACSRRGRGGTRCCCSARRSPGMRSTATSRGCSRSQRTSPHLAAAAVWLGGLLSLVYVLPRAADDEPTRLAVARRFSKVALAAVLVLGVGGVARALTELAAVHQLW